MEEGYEKTIPTRKNLKPTKYPREKNFKPRNYTKFGTILNRTRDGYEAVGNIKVAYVNSFKQPEVANEVDYVTK